MKIIAIVALIFVLVQIGLGGAVRITNSGLSCPDWPLCNGLWIPTPEALAAISDLSYEPWQVMLEWLHRTNAALVVAPAVLLLVAVAWKSGPLSRMLAGLSLILVILQALLGRFTVLDLNSAESVTSHLVLAFLLIVILVGIASTKETIGNKSRYFSFDRPSPGSTVRIVTPDSRRMVSGSYGLAWSTVLLAIATGALGAFTAKTGSTSVCNSWPGCTGWNLPDFSEAGVSSHMAHRVLALATAIATAILLYRTTSKSATLSSAWVLVASMLVVFQVLLGILVVLQGAHFLTALLHQMVGALIVTSLAAAAWAGHRN